MKEITHKQAQSYLRLDLDGLLSDVQRLDLQTHLAGCEACRAESDSLSTLTSRLQSEFHERWDAQDGPSHNVLTNVHSQTRRIAMSNKAKFGLRALAGVAALILLGFGLNYVISQLRDQSVTASVTPIPGNFMPVAVPNAEKRLLAFTMKKNGETDVYTVRADGSSLTNLTGDSNGDNPYWSPDGKRIAFNRNQQVFIMDADGSNVIQLTEDGDLNRLVSFEEGREAGFDAWSPDGSKLVFVKIDFNQASSGGFMKLYVLDVETKTQTPLTSEWGLFQSPAWSPDGEHIAFTAFIVNEQGEPTSMSVQVIGADGNNLVNLTESLPEDEPSFFDYWSTDGQSVFFNSYKTSNETSKVYEAKLDGSLIELSQPTPGFLEWWDGTVLTVNSEDATLKWLRPDGASSSLTVCPRASDTMKISSTRSKAGILFFGAHCTRGEWSLYLSNKDGSTVQTLLDSPLSAGDGVMVDQAWSADDNYIAFNISSRSENTVEMFILDVVGTLNDPMLEPVRFDVGDIFSSVDSLSWQPVIPKDSLVKENETDAEQHPQANDRLLAFTMENDGNLDIYTMHANGSRLTNITNNPAQDVSPSWSPDGKRIAFETDRNGYRQIFLMNADGSNLVQLSTHNEDEVKADQWIGEPYDLSLNLWSPDGNKLIFYELVNGEEDGKLYMIDANGENKKPLVNKTGKYSSPSWSPDGKHIAFIAIENSVARIYSTDANGDNLREATRMMPRNETLYPVKYSWSRDSQSISFIASTWNYILGGGEGSPNYKWKAYEASLDGNTLITNALADSQIGGYWNGTYFLSGSTAVSSSPAFTWIHLDGTNTTLNPTENCQKNLDSNTGDYVNGYSTYKQSLNGNVVVGAYCPNGDKWLYWADSGGTFRQLLNSPIHVQSIPTNATYLWAPRDFIWSSDDQYIAFSIFSSGKTDMYIVNVNDALQNPLIQPFHMTISNDSSNYTLSYSPVWQPVTVKKAVTTDEKTIQTSSYDGLIAFTSAVEDGNLNIYTVRFDGTELTNLTKNPAHDVNPFWSPDGKRIAFTSDRAGYIQIFTMNADGSNVFQVTNNEANHEFQSFFGDSFNPWSPDGSSLAFIEQTPDGNHLLSRVDVDSGNTVSLVSQPGLYSSISWSPDGSHVAYIVLEPVGDRDMARIHVVNASGDNNTNITAILPEDEDLSSWNYTWTREGNIRFVAGRGYAENGNTKFAVYEAIVDGATLVEITKTSTPLGDYWNGTTFVMGFTRETLTWLRSDGTFSEFKPYENCQMGSQPGYFGLSRRSSSGYLLYAAVCPNGDLWLYWSNPDGTDVKQLLPSPINTTGGGLGDINWSPDSSHVALTVSSSGITDLYILDVPEALKGPFALPEPIVIGGGDINYNISWQPLP